MFLYGGLLPTDTASTKIEKKSYSERHPFPDWREHADIRKSIKKKQYKGVMFTPLPDTSFFAMRLRNPEEIIKFHSMSHCNLLPPRNNISQTSSKLAQSIPDSITTSTTKNIETTAKKTNIFKSILKFFTKFFRKASKI